MGPCEEEASLVLSEVPCGDVFLPAPAPLHILHALCPSSRPGPDVPSRTLPSLTSPTRSGVHDPRPSSTFHAPIYI